MSTVLFSLGKKKESLCFPGGFGCVLGAWEVTDSHKGALSSLLQGFNQN